MKQNSFFWETLLVSSPKTKFTLFFFYESRTTLYQVEPALFITLDCSHILTYLSARGYTLLQKAIAFYLQQAQVILNEMLPHVFSFSEELCLLPAFILRSSDCRFCVMFLSLSLSLSNEKKQSHDQTKLNRQLLLMPTSVTLRDEIFMSVRPQAWKCIHWLHCWQCRLIQLLFWPLCLMSCDLTYLPLSV